MSKSRRARSAAARPVRSVPAAVRAPIPAWAPTIVPIAAAVAAVLERLWFSQAWGETGSLTSVFYYGDATRFLDYARAIVDGRLFDNGIPFHPPGWPIALAALFHLTGGSGIPVTAIKWLLAILSGASAGIAARLAFEIAGPGAMLAVALLGPFHFGHIVEGAVANSEAFYGLLTTIAVWAAWRWVRDERPVLRRNLAWAALCGAAGAAAMLVRAEFLACAVALAAIAFWRRRHAAAIVVFLAAFGIVLTPTTIWHHRTLAAFNAAHTGRVAGPLPTMAPVTSYGPFNFAMANHEYADGGPNRDHPMFDQCSAGQEAQLVAGGLDLACPAIYDLYVHGYRIGLTWIFNHPGDALALVARKISMTAGFLAQGYLIDDAGGGIEGVRRRVDLLDPASWWLLPIHLALLVAGVLAMRRRVVALAVLAAPAAALAGSVVLFYGYVRLGVAYLPIVWIAQGAAIAAIASRAVREWRWQRVIAGVLGAMAILVIADGVRARVPRRAVLEGAVAPDGSLMQDETLRVHPAP
jgi:hypothetical protein